MGMKWKKIISAFLAMLLSSGMCRLFEFSGEGVTKITHSIIFMLCYLCVCKLLED